MPGGYMGKILRIDLSDRSIALQPLPEEDILRTWVGGTGLGLHLLFQHIRTDASVSDPDTPIVLITGPLTGTLAPSSSDWKLVTLRGDMKIHPAITQAHGHLGARLKHAGYDGMILTGAASEPVMICVDDDKVEIRPAARYWGMDTIETQNAILRDLGNKGDTSIACIGPAGEAQLRGATIRADYSYGLSKGGLGAVWGARNLKALTVRGTGTVPIHDPEAFMQACDDWRAAITKLQKTHNTRNAPYITKMGVLCAAGRVPGKNFTDHDLQADFAKSLAEDMPKWKIEAVGSWECPIKCHNKTVVTTGPYAGTVVTGFTMEVFEGAGTNIGVTDPGTAVAMAGFWDAMGADPSEVGRLIALAYEMYNKGYLTEADTGGLKLEWGNEEAARELFMMTLRREGIGATLAKGFREACAELGRGAEGMIQHIKGVGFNDHELRGYGIAFLFGQMVSGAGPTWQTLGAEAMGEPDLGYVKPMDPASPDGKAEMTYKTQIKKLWEDCIGVCVFACWGIEGITNITPRALSAATGFDFDWEDAKTLGERVIQLQRLFALKRGFRKSDDMDISERMLRPVPSGPAKGRTLGPHLRQMLDDYYACLGWDQETGIPSDETLKRFGLDDYRFGRLSNKPTG